MSIFVNTFVVQATQFFKNICIVAARGDPYRFLLLFFGLKKSQNLIRRDRNGVWFQLLTDCHSCSNGSFNYLYFWGSQGCSEFFLALNFISGGHFEHMNICERYVRTIQNYFSCAPQHFCHCLWPLTACFNIYVAPQGSPKLGLSAFSDRQPGIPYIRYIPPFLMNRTQHWTEILEIIGLFHGLMFAKWITNVCSTGAEL